MRYHGLSVILLFCTVAAVTLVFKPGVTGLFRSEKQGGELASLIRADLPYWKLRIKKVGAEKAYAELGEKNRTRTPNEAHMRAHAFGAALYETLGEAGAAVCDTRDSYGCFHEFMTRLILAEGIGKLSSLYKECDSHPPDVRGSCLHGMGHGIVAYVGYTKDDLEKALALCDSVGAVDVLNGCYAGVVMEYNDRVAINGSLSDIRPFRGDLFEPCRTISTKYLGACILGQPAWWRLVLLKQMDGGNTDFDKEYKNFGTYCREFATTTPLLQDCYRGIAYAAVRSAQFDTDMTGHLCDAAANQPVHAHWCRAWAAGELRWEINVADASRICTGLTDAVLSECMSAAARGRSFGESN